MSLLISTTPLILPSTKYALSRLITTFKTAIAKQATNRVDRTLKNAKRMSICQRIECQALFALSRILIEDQYYLMYVTFPASGVPLQTMGYSFVGR